MTKTMTMAALVLMATVSTAAADLTGKWAGTLSGTAGDGTTRTDTALLILTQKDTTVTGSVGGSETDQHTITSGRVMGDKVTIMATTPNGREIKLDLTVAGDEMKGKLLIGEQQAEITVKRQKP